MRKSNLKREEATHSIIKPGITTLSKCVDSRYTLVTMVAKRARMIGGSNDESTKVNMRKPVSLSVEEVASGKVGYIRRERCYNEDTFYTENIKDDAVNLDELEALENSYQEAATSETEE